MKRSLLRLVIQRQKSLYNGFKRPTYHPFSRDNHQVSPCLCNNTCLIDQMQQTLKYIKTASQPVCTFFLYNRNVIPYIKTHHYVIRPNQDAPTLPSSFFLYYLPSVAICNAPSSISFKLRLLNRSREYCIDAFLQSVPAFIIEENSSQLIFPSCSLWQCIHDQKKGYVNK